MVRHIGESEFVPKVRYVGRGVTMFFRGKDEIYVSDGRQTVLFERWFDGRSVYREKWRPFTRMLERNNSIETVGDCIRMANRYGIIMHSTTFPEIPDNATILPSYYKNLRRARNAT